MYTQKPKMKSPLSYYGGKVGMLPHILPNVPDHQMYVEPFFGSGAVFFGKERSPLEVINDTNHELVNFYKIIKTDFEYLQMMIQRTPLSRQAYNDAVVMYQNPWLFTDVQRAWALWVMANMSFSGILGGSWGYARSIQPSRKLHNKRESFLEAIKDRLDMAQIDCNDAEKVMVSRDCKSAFHYVDPPYFNSDCGHYSGYTEKHFESLLNTLGSLDGKFLLSSYPSPVLAKHAKKKGWHQVTVKKNVAVTQHTKKTKIEVLTANYPIQLLS